jgi:plasmid stability protein
MQFDEKSIIMINASNARFPMASLQIRELPEPLYEKLEELARRDHRSLSQQAIVVLAQGLGVEENPRERIQSLLRRLEQQPLAKSPANLPDPVKIVRADRSR